MSTTTTTRIGSPAQLAVAGIAATGGAAAPAVGGLRRPDAGRAARRLRASRALPGPLVDPGKPAADMKVLKTDARHRRLPARRSRSPAPACPPNKDVLAHLGHGERDWVARPARPTASTTSAGRPPSSPSCSRTAKTDANGAFTRRAEGADGLRRHPRHLRRRRRHAGREGRLPDRPLGDDHARSGARSGR